MMEEPFPLVAKSVMLLMLQNYLQTHPWYLTTWTHPCMVNIKGVSQTASSTGELGRIYLDNFRSELIEMKIFENTCCYEVFESILSHLHDNWDTDHVKFDFEGRSSLADTCTRSMEKATFDGTRTAEK